MKMLSVVIPAYNEERYITSLLERITQVPIEQAGFSKEIVVIDDGSQDNTYTLASRVSGVRCIQQANQGKGAAVQRGMRECTGDFVIVQDADLEYDPADYLPMVRVLSEDPGAIVYGSRPLGILASRGWRLIPGKHENQSFGAWLANSVLTLWILLLYGRWITDPLTAYKLYPLALIRSFQIKTHGFETDHEITAKLIKKGRVIREVPIRYAPRTVTEGKKIKARDGFIALWTLLKYRFVN